MSVGFKTGFYALGAMLALTVCVAGATSAAGSAAARGPQPRQADQSGRNVGIIQTGRALRASTSALLPEKESLPQDNPSVRGDAANIAGRRDPFKLPTAADEDGIMAPPVHRPPGVRGLLVSELSLEGVVSENSGHDMIAVVTNNTGRAYFLHENEQLFDGKLTKITPQAAYFVETLRDRKGHESIQQVVKWLSSKPGDAQ